METPERLLIVGGVAGGVTLLLLAFGITAWALSSPEPEAPPPVATEPTVESGPVTVQFVGVPGGVVLEVDGRPLGPEGLFSVAPSLPNTNSSTGA